MGNASDRCLHLARWLSHRLPDICEGATTKTGGTIAYSVALSVGQFTSREADRSKDRSPPAAFAHASASQKFCTAPVPPILPLTPQSSPLVSAWPKASHRTGRRYNHRIPEDSLGNGGLLQRHSYRAPSIIVLEACPLAKTKD